MAERATGFTLVEVLATLAVLSVGLLGIAALYLASLRSSQSALYQTQAVMLASDIAERIRANRSPAGAYACPSPCTPGAAGNAIAAADLAAWLADITARLPAGRGEIAFAAGTATTPDRHVVTIRWQAIGVTSPQSHVLRFERWGPP